MISIEEYLEMLKMKKDQKPTPNLRDLLGIKEPSDRGGKKPIFKKAHFTIWYFVIAFLIILFIQNYISSRRDEDIITYSEFKESLRADKIKDLAITPELITGKRETEKGLRKFQTVRVEDADLVKELEARHVRYEGKVAIAEGPGTGFHLYSLLARYLEEHLPPVPLSGQ